MNTKIHAALFVTLLAAVTGGRGQTPLGTGFTYQGQLKDGGQSVNGPVDLVFKLYDAAALGNLVGTQALNGVAVTDGMFTVTLNAGGEFGASAFNGDKRWLEISVNGTTLLPRQELSALPYALQTRGIFVSANGSVGLGNTSPISRLSITGGLHVNDDLDEDVSFITSNYSIRNSDNNNLAYRYMSDPEQHDFFGFGTSRMTITAGGVGIGTSTPAWPLHVVTGGLAAVRAESTSTVGQTTTGYFSTASDIGNAIFGTATASTGSGTGVRGYSSGPSGVGVYGRTTSGTGFNVGVRGESSSAIGAGVWGAANFTGASSAYGVYGTSSADSGRGVYGSVSDSNGANAGVYGATSSNNGYGVYGVNYHSVTFAAGIKGETLSDFGVGIWGNAPNTTGFGTGVFGRSDAPAGTGVRGLAAAQTGDSVGVEGRSDSDSGTGVYGLAFSDTGLAIGVTGESDANSGRGIYGVANATSGFTYGAYGEVASTSGSGVYGASHATSGTNYGGRFYNHSTTGYGVYARADAATGITYGGRFEVDSTSGRALYAYAGASSGTIYGVYGIASTAASGFAVYAAGDMAASGLKPFRIDHPADPENKYLMHYAAESPEVINFYRGMVTLDASGEAVVTLPDYFARINRSPSYQLTAVGAPMPGLYVSEEISEAALVAGAAAEPASAVATCTFRIAGVVGGAKVSWQVQAVRNDAYARYRGAPVEVEKDAVERGKYQHPELYGQPAEMGMDAIHDQQALDQR